MDTTEGASERTTVINTTLNEHIEELDNIKKRTKNMIGNDWTQYAIYLDDAAVAL